IWNKAPRLTKMSGSGSRYANAPSRGHFDRVGTNLFNRRAAVLVCKDEFWILDEPVEYTKHLPHDGYEAELSWFSAGREPLIERGEDWIVTSGSNCGHVEHMTHLS